MYYETRFIREKERKLRSLESKQLSRFAEHPMAPSWSSPSTLVMYSGVLLSGVNDRLDLSTTGLLEAIAECVRPRLRSMLLRDLSNLAWGFAAQGYLDQGVMAGVAHEVSEGRTSVRYTPIHDKGYPCEA